MSTGKIIEYCVRSFSIFIISVKKNLFFLKNIDFAGFQNLNAYKKES